MRRFRHGRLRKTLGNQASNRKTTADTFDTSKATFLMTLSNTPLRLFDRPFTLSDHPKAFRPPHIVMAKIFYTVEEACAKLGKSNDEVMDLLKSGKLREFRDQGNLMFKVEDVHTQMPDTDGDDLDLKLGSGIIDLNESKESFELDLSESNSPTTSVNPKSDSPVGMSAPAAIEDAFELDMELGSVGDADISVEQNKNTYNTDDLSLEMDLDSSNASAAPAQSAGLSSISNSPIPSLEDEGMTIELDMSDSLPTTAPSVAAPKIKSPPIEEVETASFTLEDSLSGVISSPSNSADDSQLDNLSPNLQDSNAGDFDSHAGSQAGGSAGGSAGLEADQITLDQPGSGSGLMDLTQESEDSQMGAALMDEAFQGDEDDAPKNASGIFGGATSESGINEAAVVSSGSVPTMVPTFAGTAVAASEIYSGSWSGLTVGLLVPCIVGLTATAAMLVVKTLGGTPELAVMFAQDWMTWTGGFAGAIAVCGGIGFFVGKATE